MWFIIIFLVVLTFGLGAWLGAPYLPILGRDSRPLLDLAGLKAGDTLIDLGSGDGRLLRAAAARGIKGIGYEINPLLVIISWIICWRYRRLVKIYLADFWHTRLPPADAIYVFLIDRYMKRLDKKLTTEVTSRTLVVSFIFKIPGRRPIKHNLNAQVYQYEAPSA